MCSASDSILFPIPSLHTDPALSLPSTIRSVSNRVPHLYREDFFVRVVNQHVLHNSLVNIKPITVVGHHIGPFVQDNYTTAFQILKVQKNAVCGAPSGRIKARRVEHKGCDTVEMDFGYGAGEVIQMVAEIHDEGVACIQLRYSLGVAMGISALANYVKGLLECLTRVYR